VEYGFLQPGVVSRLKCSFLFSQDALLTCWRKRKMASVVHPQSSDRDERLARLLAALTDEARKNQAPDLEAVAAQHPDLAAELRELWAAARFADEFAKSSATLRQTPTKTERPADGPDQLPRSFGDYELLEELGRGGMGVVYKAKQKSLQRIVALKMILRGAMATTADQARFQAESRAAAHLQHPNIVAVYEAGECTGQAYFSMQYVEGQTLASLMTAGPLRPHDAARILAAVSRAVHFAHQHGILHRDLKPSNVLLDRDGLPHVTDFGLAKRVPPTRSAELGARSEEIPQFEFRPPSLTISGAIIGTPAYMAPEQVSNSRGKPSPASDVYSLGVILYEMLTGRPPFQGATPVDTLLLVLDQDPVRPRLLNPKVDPDLELICLKCLQKEPDLRYPSAADLAADLEAFLHSEDLSVRTWGLRNLRLLFTQMFRDTHHAPVLENWGVLWMAHSVAIFIQCVLTTWMKWSGVEDPWLYLLLWGGGLCLWGAFFWQMRKRGGPVLFVERQVAHVWAAAVMATIGVFVVEILLRRQYPDIKALTLSPILAVIAGMTFVVQAAMLSGEFYISAAVMFLTTIPMALFPDYGPLLFGAAVAACFFVPGWKYHRQRLRALRAAEPSSTP
jgi:eukaryotic-like serine/threonine-protein kinase